MKIASDLSEVSARLFKSMRDRSIKSRRAALFVKAGLIGVGSAFATIAQFMQFGPDGPTAWQLIGIVASVIVAIGAAFVVLTEDDASKEMLVAHEALEKAREIQEESERYRENEKAIERAVNLYSAISIMRGALERATVNKRVPDDVIVAMMDLAARNLPIAMGFQQSDQWTICMYKAVQQPSGKYLLQCIAQDRAIKCSTADARSWPEGVGVAGISFSNAREVIVPDLQAHEFGSVFNVGSHERTYDSSRYRAIVAVPVLVDKQKIPWGVAVATSDRPYHFYQYAEPGIKTFEAVRALAAMAALAVAIQQWMPEPPQHGTATPQTPEIQ